MHNQLPTELIGYIFDFLDRDNLYALLKCFPGFVSNCCIHVRFKLMLFYISELEFDYRNQPTFKSKRKKATWIRYKKFLRGVEHVENSKVFTPRQTMMIYYPKKSLKVLFETIGPYILGKINNWRSFVEKDEKMIKKFYYHFYNIKLSLELLKSRIFNAPFYERNTKFSAESLETCLFITKNYKSRLNKLNTVIATYYLSSLKNEFYLKFAKTMNENKVNAEFYESWNEKFKLIHNHLSYSTTFEKPKKAISFIISTMWNNHDNLLELLPLIRCLSRTVSEKHVTSQAILLEICNSKTVFTISTAQDIKRVKNLMEVCSYFETNISEFMVLVERFLDKVQVSSEIQEEFNSLKTVLLNKYELK